MGLIFFNNIYFDLDDPDGLYQPIPPVYEFMEFIQTSLYASPEQIELYKLSPFRLPFSFFYGFAQHFRPASMTRRCADAVEKAEESMIDISSPSNPTLITYSKLSYYMLLHAHPVVRSCIYSGVTELSKLVTYITFENYIASMGTVDYWFKQD